ncbi:GAS2-like protein 2 [Carlito syrichta]|uniref:GAS2-like protein 2 n=1 Tax=Carlito syrichta TaxID=1868482 RepID=A0A1U7UQI1_CARSF|nr:GAS2-like protein 2 [Carlito syrichta]
MAQPAGRRRPGTLGSPVRSIRPFKSSEQYLEAMKEDLAEWLHDLYGLDIDAANFLQVLETGLVLCQHANTITEAALAFLAKAPARAQRIPMPRAGVSCNGAAQPGTFQARDNVSNFIQWCRKEMGIQEVLMFETEDLVLRKNVRNVVLCLLELGRRAWRFGVAAPTLVQLEEEIDQELRRERALPAPGPPPPAPPERMELTTPHPHPQVQSLVSHCTCPVQFSMVKMSEGKYRVGDSNTLIFIRILRNHVMVRVGGGWDTLGHYLDKHDPCRCSSLSHKPGSFLKPPAPPVQHEVRVQDGPSQPQPTMTVSRSQSPLPPVDWKTYTSSGRKLRSPTPSSPRPRSERGAGAGALGEMAPFLRCQERSPTPSQSQLTAEDSSPSPQFSSIYRGRDPQYTSSGKREDRYPPELPRRRIPTSWVHEQTHARTPTPQRLQVPEAITKGMSAREPCSLPHSCSPAKALGLRLPLWDEAEGASSQLREPASVQSPSPVKELTNIPIRLPPGRPPTPGRSFSSTASGSPRTELGRGSIIPLRAITGDLAVSRHEDCSVEGTRGDLKLDIQVTAEAREPRCLGPQEQEGRSTPQPLHRTREKVIYNSLEEEILVNMKLLEVAGACPKGTESGVIPRSGVYVPSLGGQWPEPGDPYDKVIQELSRGPPPLMKVDLEAWKTAPRGPPKLAVTAGPGSPKGMLGAEESGSRTKASLSATGASLRKVLPQGGHNCSAPMESTSPEVPPPSPSNPSSDKAKARLGKVKRTLRKPQRVPSIYKLKLRPKIRPRRDHRPEKQPSRIPKPLTYLCLGPARPLPRGRLLRAVPDSKGGEASREDGASAGEKEDEEKTSELSTLLESSPQPSEGLGPQLEQAPLPSEEESWV